MARSGTQLSAENVNRIFKACLTRGYEVLAKSVAAECDKTVKFHQGRLNEHREDIRNMLGQLNERFRGANGWEFLAASVTWDGRSWTGEDGREDVLIEKLVLLGIAIGAVKYPVPLKDCNDWPDFRVNL